MRRRYGSRSPGRLEGRKIREKYRKEHCSKGKHYWYPLFIQTEWNKKDVVCFYCSKEKQYKNLTKDQRGLVKSIAETLKESYAKVRALHPTIKES